MLLNTKTCSSQMKTSNFIVQILSITDFREFLEVKKNLTVDVITDFSMLTLFYSTIMIRSVKGCTVRVLVKVLFRNVIEFKQLKDYKHI